jgi:potassium uptake TrkH family protein
VEVFRKFRENIKLSIWDYINIAHRILRNATAIVSTFAMVAILYSYGFPQTEQSQVFCNIIIRSSLIFYILRFLLSAFFNVHSTRYIKKHWITGLVVLFIIIDFILPFSDIVMLLVQLYFFIAMLGDLFYAENFLGKIKIRPGGLIVASFLVLIAVGTALLLLPEMTTNKISFVDALFTATSASCITGLSSLDIGANFTFKGQFIILLLIQLGGINIVCFASFFAYFYKGKRLKYQSVMKEMLNTTLEDSRKLTREVVLYTLFIEFIGFAFLFFHLHYTQNHSEFISDNAFLSAFHAIASFNNAGFCFLEGGMTDSFFRYDYYVQTVTMVLIFLGGIGFLTMNDILTLPKGKNRWKYLEITSKVVLRLSLVFILFGAVSFFIFEYNNVSADSSLLDRIYMAFFTSISSRTAGFNTVDIPSLSMSTRLIFIVLMLIGAAPGSTSGGIKLTTFYILFKSAIATISGKHQVTMYNRSVSFEVVDKAYVVLVFTIVVVLTGSFLLTVIEPQLALEEIFFEVASAFGTAGVSSGVTANLSAFGKFIIAIIMFIGRITVLTLALSIARRAFSRYSLAETKVGI